MKGFAFCLAGFVIGIMQRWYILLLSVILILVGLAWSSVCTYIGLGILAVYLLYCLYQAIQMRHFAQLTVDTPEMESMMEQLMEQAAEREKLHGEDLLPLTNEELCATIYDQNITICEEAEDAEDELALFSGARRTVYIVNTFDAEVQNGGLCQFFVNSSRCLAPYISEALATIGADAHKKLYDDFIATNHIDVTDLDSFIVTGVRGYKKQTKRYDFDAFDDRYYELDDMEDLIAKFIRTNITEF